MKPIAVTMALLSLLHAPNSLSAQSQTGHLPFPFITVVGHGKASAKPDMAEIQVGVVTQASNAAKALQQNSDAMAKLLSTLEARGIPKTDVQTANFNVMPQYRRGPHGEQQPGITGYEVSNQVRLKVRKLDLLGPVLDELVEQGANQVRGISFAVAESTPLLDQARRQAIADARRKAELYASAAAVPLGRVLAIQEETPQQPRPMAFGLAKAAPSVPIAEGEQDFAASLTVTYALRDK
jgi:uncharacterized protein